MHRLIMLSSTYQMSTTYDAQAAAQDPENRLLWRRNRQRLDAESIRDSLLFVAGNLDLSMGGSLLPTENRKYVTSTANVNPVVYDTQRRSTYLPIVRSALYEVFQAFDFADPAVLLRRKNEHHCRSSGVVHDEQRIGIETIPGPRRATDVPRNDPT